MSLNDSGLQNPIFELMRAEEYNNNLNFDNFEDNIMMPPVLFPPLINIRNNSNKKNLNEKIDKMLLSLKNFNENIQLMLDTTNRMNNIINKYEINFINLTFEYKSKKIFMKCKLEDVISDVISKLKFGEENFNINDKFFIYCAKRIDISKKFKEEKILSYSTILILDKAV